MNVTVEVVGDHERDLSLSADATYADVVRESGYSPQEASVLVDGSPVPGDQPVEAERVKLLRLVKGGSGESAGQDTQTGDAGDADNAADEAGDTDTDADEADPNNLDFSLPNPGPGPDPLSLSKLDADLAVLVFHRDHLCGNCRKQVDDFCGRYAEFVEHDAEVIGVLPEPEERAADWVDHHDMPYPMLADPDATLGDRYGQAIKLGPIGRRVDLIGRMPAVAIVDVRREPELLWSHTGSNPVDRPALDTVLRELEKFS